MKTLRMKFMSMICAFLTNESWWKTMTWVVVFKRTHIYIYDIKEQMVWIVYMKTNSIIYLNQV